MTRRAAVLVALGILVAPIAYAVIPDAGKITAAAAQKNVEAKRNRTLRLDVELRRGRPDDVENELLATGSLVSDPAGLARLELRGVRGGSERHLLRGGRVLAVRDGQPLASPRPYLAPVPLLQASTGGRLRDGLLSLGVAVGVAELGRSHGHDCWVVGGRNPSAPGGSASGGLPALWVDLESHEIVGVERRDGVRFRLGPVQTISGLSVPSWIWAAEPGTPPVHLRVTKAQAVKAGSNAFDPAWLTSP